MSARAPVDHVVILDGTFGSLMPGMDTNAGEVYRLLLERRDPRVTLYYEPGLQWQGLRKGLQILAGVGINRQIRRAYRFLCHRYRPGDRVFLLGYSRGAYAVRSLAGIIDRYGLLRAEVARDRNVRFIYSYYAEERGSGFGDRFADRYCHRDVMIEAIGVFDTVKALGMNLPLLSRLAPMGTEFHSDQLGHSARHGYHALALDERRLAYAPVLWRCPPGWQGHVEQVWFRGCHGDVGGQLLGQESSRPLANIPLVWMVERLELCGLKLPSDWRGRFPCDVEAPSVGMNRGWGKMFFLRRRRMVGQDPSERLHETVPEIARPKRLGLRIGWKRRA